MRWRSHPARPRRDLAFVRLHVRHKFLEVLRGRSHLRDEKLRIRADHPDVIYRTEESKFEAVIDEILDLNKEGRPVLVGTVSVEKSERLARMLEKRGVPHAVLNAKQHEREAAIVAGAGQKGAVMIATNMAGRGTDIVLGEGVREVGGLHIIGTERHESRRIDNQLRGRSGRQGDPGSSRFFISLEDDLMKKFGPAADRIGSMMERLEVEPIEHPWVARSIESAQKKVEGFNFDARKHVVEYDDVMNKQREIIYGERRKVLEGADTRTNVESYIRDLIDKGVEVHCQSRHPENWDLDGLVQYNPKNILTRLYRARILMLAGETEAAIAECNAILLPAPVLPAISRCGACCRSITIGTPLLRIPNASLSPVRKLL